MESLFNWMLGSDDVAQRMELFANTNCHLFDYVEDRAAFEDAENKLVYTDTYNLFQQQFEAELNHFLSTMGWSVDTLIAACQAEEAKSKEDSMFNAYEMLISLSDYNVFKVMMLEQRKKQVEEAQQ